MPRSLRRASTLIFYILTTLAAPSLSHLAAADDPVKLTDVVFAREFDNADQPLKPGNEFFPTEKIRVKASLNSRPTSGKLRCEFYYQQQKITEVALDLAELSGRDVPKDYKPYGLFSLTPKSDFPVGTDYRAHFFFNDADLGSYPFRIVADKASSQVPAETARPPADTTTSTTDRNRSDQKPANPMARREVIDRLLRSTAYVEGADENGRTWSGTAWIVDKERRLLVTNDHVANVGGHDSSFGAIKKFQAYFPDHRDGRLVHDVKHYLNNVRPIQLKVVYGDKKRDLALLQAESLPANVQQLSLAPRSTEIGERLHSLGGIPAGSEGLWIYTQGFVRAVYRRHLASGFRAQTVEADMQTNKGNSGGPILNDAGELVAVVEGHMATARSVSMYIDLSEVRSFLNETMPLAEPTTVDQFVSRGEQHYEAGRYDQCLADFTSVLRKDPKHSYAISSRGWTFYQKGDTDTAMSEFNTAIKLDPTMLYAYRGRATIELEQGNYEKAIDDLTFSIRSCTDKEEMAELYTDRGDAYSETEQYEAALSDLDRAIVANAKHPQAHANRAHVLTQLERYQEAIQSIDAAFKLDPQNPEYFNLAGNAWLAEGSYEMAAKAYGEAIQRRPRDPVYLENRADAFRLLERYQDAAKDLLAAIQLDESNDDLYNDMGVIFFEAKDFRTAYMNFAKASDLNPNVAVYWYNRGNSAFEYGNHAQAVTDLTKSIELEASADAYDLRGRAHDAEGNSAAAKRDREKSVELAPDQYRKFSTKYLTVSNRAGEPLKVFLQYYTTSPDGSFRWYPSMDRALWFTFQPGDKAPLMNGDFKIHGRKFRIWAEGQTSGVVYDKNKEEDFVVVDDAGYVSESDQLETHEFTFIK